MEGSDIVPAAEKRVDRPRPFLTVVSQGLTAFRSCWKTLVATLILASLVVILCDGIALALFFLVLSAVPSFAKEFAALGTLWFLMAKGNLLLTALAAEYLTLAATGRILAERLLGRPTGTLGGLRRTLARWWELTTAFAAWMCLYAVAIPCSIFLGGIIQGYASLWFGIPPFLEHVLFFGPLVAFFVWASVAFSLTPLVASLEGRAGFSALWRSWTLVRGSYLRVTPYWLFAALTSRVVPTPLVVITVPLWAASMVPLWIDLRLRRGHFSAAKLNKELFSTTSAPITVRAAKRPVMTPIRALVPAAPRVRPGRISRAQRSIAALFAVPPSARVAKNS